MNRHENEANNENQFQRSILESKAFNRVYASLMCSIIIIQRFHFKILQVSSLRRQSTVFWNSAPTLALHASTVPFLLITNHIYIFGTNACIMIKKTQEGTSMIIYKKLSGRWSSLSINLNQISNIGNS